VIITPTSAIIGAEMHSTASTKNSVRTKRIRIAFLSPVLVCRVPLSRCGLRARARIFVPFGLLIVAFFLILWHLLPGFLFCGLMADLIHRAQEGRRR
jgi:hypothetical protein